MGVKFGVEESNFSRLLHTKYHPHRCRVGGMLPKMEILRTFYQISRYKCVTLAHSLSSLDLQGDDLHQWGGGKFDVGSWLNSCGLNKGKIYQIFKNQILEYKRLVLAYLLPNFYDIFGNYGELYDKSCIKILWDSLKEFQSCGSLNLRGSGYLPNFQHPIAAKLHLMHNKLKIHD